MLIAVGQALSKKNTPWCMGEKVLRYAADLQNDGFVVLRRVDSWRQLRDGTAAKISTNRASRSKGCYGKRMPAAPSHSNVRNVRGQRRDSGRRNGGVARLYAARPSRCAGTWGL